MAEIWSVPGAEEDWVARSDVLFHFFAYQHFAKKADRDAGIDLVNLTDGDVQFYNRTFDNIKGLRKYGELAKYLHAFLGSHPSVEGTTHRAQLVRHVRDYNTTVDARRRFYMLNLSNSELELLAITPTTGSNASDKITVATDGLANNDKLDENADRDEVFVQQKILEELQKEGINS